jgi:hypothetical protein
MAGWGTGSFENEDASNWVSQIDQLTVEDLRALLSRADKNEYLEAAQSGAIVAAAEAVAALGGVPAEALPEPIADWANIAQPRTSDALLQELVGLALQAVLHVRTNSELKDLWLQADGLNEWTANLRRLEKRLTTRAALREPPALASAAIADESTIEARALLRHTVATLAYRGGKAVRNAPATFADYRCGESSRTAGQILAHIGDLLDWGLSIAEGRRTWHDATPLPWEQEIDRFFAALQTFDAHLASEAPLHVSAEKLFQGPIADALTHVGQIAMLRRMAGVPIKGESYFEAEIAIGQVGSHQPAPRKEFD